MKTKLLTLLLCFHFILNAQQVPTPDHVMIVVLENHAYSQIIGSASAPYINSLANDPYAALFTQSFGVTHPSQPNYLYLFSGSSQNVILDFTPVQHSWKREFISSPSRKAIKRRQEKFSFIRI